MSSPARSRQYVGFVYTAWGAAALMVGFYLLLIDTGTAAAGEPLPDRTILIAQAGALLTTAVTVGSIIGSIATRRVEREGSR